MNRKYKFLQQLLQHFKSNKICLVQLSFIIYAEHFSLKIDEKLCSFFYSVPDMWYFCANKSEALFSDYSILLPLFLFLLLLLRMLLLLLLLLIIIIIIIIIIHQEINNTIPGTASINKQKQPNRNEPPTSENGNTTQPNNAQPNNPEETLTQKQGKSRNFKDNYEPWKNFFTIIKKHKMEKS